MALGQTGRLKEAVAQFQAAVRLKPDFADARYNLGVALAHIGRNPEAMLELEELVRLKPDDAQAREILSELRAAHGE